MFDSTEWHRNYRRDKLKRISLELQKDYAETVKNHAETMQETTNGFIKRAIAETMARDKKKLSKNAGRPS